MLQALERRDEALEIFCRHALFLQHRDMPLIDGGDHCPDPLSLFGEAQTDDPLILRGALVIEVSRFDELGDRVAEIGAGIVSPDPQFRRRELAVTDIVEEDGLGAGLLGIADLTLELELDQLEEATMQAFQLAERPYEMTLQEGFLDLLIVPGFFG